MKQEILVAGIGNIFFGDDAFGIEVVNYLTQRQPPEHLQVVDFGIRGFDLAFALLEDYDAAILVDTAQRGGEPGELYVLKIDPDLVETEGASIQTHNVNPVEVLSLVRMLGGRPRQLYMVACEPATFGEDEGGCMGLSPQVRASVDDAVDLVKSLTERIRTGERYTNVKDTQQEIQT